VSRRQRDDANLHLMDGRDLFGTADVADLPDGLHPNTAGYVRMGHRFASAAFGSNGMFASATKVAAPR
jgi:lysophospholipase L1-like esterase